MRFGLNVSLANSEISEWFKMCLCGQFWNMRFGLNVSVANSEILEWVKCVYVVNSEIRDLVLMFENKRWLNIFQSNLWNMSSCFCGIFFVHVFCNTKTVNHCNTDALE